MKTKEEMDDGQRDSLIVSNLPMAVPAAVGTQGVVLGVRPDRYSASGRPDVQMLPGARGVCDSCKSPWCN